LVGAAEVASMNGHSPPDRAPALDVRELTKTFGGVRAVRSVSFSVPAGSLTALIGPNGAGKSTVFNLVTNLYRPDSGQVVLEGRPITNVPPERITSLGLFRTFQTARVFPQLSVLDNVLVGADDPEAMFRHTTGAATAGIPFAADPSQQLPRMDAGQTRQLIDGAAYLFSNEYELALIEQKTGWTAEEILARVQIQVTTLGADGARVSQAGQPAITVSSVPGVDAVDPTGGGDAFRAGFLAAVAWQLPLERAAQLGCLVAASVLETVGTQEYQLTPDTLTARFETAYGADAAKEIAQHLG